MTEFNDKIERWLQEVTDRCHGFAIKADLDFYAFQTKIISNPELLIVGINPGSNGKYTDYLSNNKQSKRLPHSIHYTENLLVEGGKGWEDGMQSTRRKFREMFHDEQLFTVLQNSVMMNAIYFNTVGSSDLTILSDEIETYCVEKTKEMIEILDPKNILIFSSDKLWLKKIGVTDIEQIDRITKSGQWNGRAILAVPHFSARGHNKKETRNEIGQMLKNHLNFK
ncbi:hypothetical protein [Sphingobacterium chungjuense]|uniref:hypothetical protein n=1 Tax=Sphingobacterium chungjuense TaxID=2675553 RepID=UPI0014079843|nr:hypothetical protein [Sphingobacterium chungjuense]